MHSGASEVDIVPVQKTVMKFTVQKLKRMKSPTFSLFLIDKAKVRPVSSPYFRTEEKFQLSKSPRSLVSPILHVSLDGVTIKTMSIGADFKEFNDELQNSLIAATRAVNQLCAEDLGFHKSLDPNVGKALDKQNARFVKLAERLVRSAVLGSEGVGEPLSLNTVEAVDNNWHSIVDTIDSLLERAATSIDQYTGTLKRASPGQVRSRRIFPRLNETNFCCSHPNPSSSRLQGLGILLVLKTYLNLKSNSSTARTTMKLVPSSRF